jgi:hypothetical protein
VAMRLLTQQELETELTKAALTPTNIFTGTACLWKCPNGLHVTVPDLRGGRIGDYILDDILRACTELYRPPGTTH